MKHKKRGAAFPLLPNINEYCRANGKLKRKYETEMEAELNAPAKDLQQYICEFCRYWHNGKGSSSKKPPLKRAS